MLDNKKGITLIALVVTVVVLIILAGVSINAVLGEKIPPKGVSFSDLICIFAMSY